MRGAEAWRYDKNTSPCSWHNSKYKIKSNVQTYDSAFVRFRDRNINISIQSGAGPPVQSMAMPGYYLRLKSL